MSAHRYAYKNTGVDARELRKKREEDGIQLRKQKREDEICKRRNLNSAEESMQDVNTSNMMQKDTIDTASATEITNEMVAALYIGDIQQQLFATQKFRELFSRESNPAIDEVIETGVIPKLVEFLQINNPTLQFEVAWALSNVTSGTFLQKSAVVQAGAVPIFVTLLNSKDEDIQEEAVCALNNIACESPEYRDYVLQNGILIPLLQLLNKSSRISITQNATLVLSNLCRGKNPPPKFEDISPCLPVLSRLIFHNYFGVLSYACWAFSYISDGPNEKIQAVIDAGVCQRLVNILMYSSRHIVLPALRTVGNIVKGNDVQTQVILNCNVLPRLLYLLSSPTQAIRTTACWTISNITAGSEQQIQAVIDASIFPVLIEILKNSKFKTRREAAWAITNATARSSSEQIRFLVEQRCIPPLCELLKIRDAKIVQVALNGLENILILGQKDVRAHGGSNPYAIMIEECYGLDNIAVLQNHENMEISRKAFDVTETYFNF